MRTLLRIAAITTTAGLLLAPATAMAASSTAHPAATHATSVHLRGGTSSITTVPGLAAALLEGGIVPFATTPGTETLLGSTVSPQLKFSFPITGGRVNPARLTGTIKHRGGILFVNTTTSGDTIKLSKFFISLTHHRLSAIVSVLGERVTVAKLKFSHARVRIGRHRVRASRIGVHLTTDAANALEHRTRHHLVHLGDEDRDPDHLAAVLAAGRSINAGPGAGCRHLPVPGAAPSPRDGS